MGEKKKKLIQIKGTKLQKICVVIQLIVLIAMIATSIYINVNNIESGFITKIPSYGLYVVIVLLLIPVFFDNDNENNNNNDNNNK